MTHETTIPTLVGVALLYYVQQWLKGPTTGVWPLTGATRAAYQAFVAAMPGADKWAHRAFAAAGSIVVSAGLHYTLDGPCSWSEGCHGTFAIPNGWAVLTGLGEWFRIYVLQQAAYTITRQPTATAATVDRQGTVTLARVGPTPGGQTP